MTGASSKATPLAAEDVPGIKELLQTVNQPQALEENLRNLKSLQGTDGLSQAIAHASDGRN
jgi:hypothetical protein